MDLTQARLVGLVALGGALGSVARYGVTGALSRGDFPWGTFAVNISGTFALGVLFFYALGRGDLSTEVRVFLSIGFFGGYTTFSTFGVETVALLRDGQLWLGLSNLLLNAGVCVVGAFLGAAVGIWMGAVSLGG